MKESETIQYSSDEDNEELIAGFGDHIHHENDVWHRRTRKDSFAYEGGRTSHVKRPKSSPSPRKKTSVAANTGAPFQIKVTDETQMSPETRTSAQASRQGSGAHHDKEERSGEKERAGSPRRVDINVNTKRRVSVRPSSSPSRQTHRKPNPGVLHSPQASPTDSRTPVGGLNLGGALLPPSPPKPGEEDMDPAILQLKEELSALDTHSALVSPGPTIGGTNVIVGPDGEPLETAEDKRQPPSITWETASTSHPTSRTTSAKSKTRPQTPIPDGFEGEEAANYLDRTVFPTLLPVLESLLKHIKQGEEMYDPVGYVAASLARSTLADGTAKRGLEDLIQHYELDQVQRAAAAKLRKASMLKQRRSSVLRAVAMTVALTPRKVSTIGNNLAPGAASGLE